MKDINIGNILKNMRNINTKYSQKELGDILKVADTTISSYERENSQPDFETITKYTRACNFDIKFYNKKTNEEFTVEELSKEM